MSDAMSFSPLWGEWYLKELIGRGTFGAVYRAEKTEYGNTYTSAVKHISVSKDNINTESLIAEGIIPNEGALPAYYDAVRDKMISEINFCYALRGNTNIVSYEDHCIIPKTDDIGYDIFIRMEHLTALPKYMREHYFGEADVIQLGIDICEALEVLDKHSMIHRDIKPANIFVNSVGVYKLGDFGESKVLSNTNVGMTVRGTYTFMSPEISRGGHADIRADIYSLGIVMYRLLNGNKAPFVPVDNNSAVSTAVVEAANVRRFSGEKLPVPQYCTNQALGSVIMKACEFAPENRWQKPKEMRRALEALQDAAKTNGQNQKTNGSSVSENPQEQNLKQSVLPPENQKKNNKLPIILVSAGVAAAAVIGLILVFALRPKDSGTVQQSSDGEISVAESTASEDISETSGRDVSSNREIVSLRIVTPPQRTTFYQNEPLDTAGMVLEAVYSDNTTETISAAECTVGSFDNTKTGIQTVTVNYKGKSAGLEITVESMPEQNTNTGSCGDGVSYVIDEGGVLTISGSGAMDDYSLGYVVTENNTIDVQCNYPWSASAKDIRRVVIDRGVTSIGSYAFYELDALTDITISDSVRKIGDSCFRGCKNLRTVGIPASVEILGKEVFVNCGSLEEFIVDSGNQRYSSDDGILYTKDKKTLLKCPESKTGGVGIVNGTVTIEEWAFDGCSKIDDLILPVSVTTIKSYAFSGCSAVSNITLLSNITNVGQYAFRYWTPSQTIRIYDRASAPNNWSSNWNGGCNADIIWNAEQYAMG